MKTDIILAGVGGQGILSVAAIVGHAAVAEGLYLKQAETHGMSQRGGDVQSHLRIASDPIASDLIPMGKADLILSGEPMESLRYLPFLSPTGYLVMGKIDAYPRHVAIDADTIAKQAGSARAANVVMLGAASPFIMTKFESLEAGIVALFSRKGADVVEANLKALRAGREQAVQMGLAK